MTQDVSSQISMLINTYLVPFGWKLIGALAVWVVGGWAVRLLRAALGRFLVARRAIGTMELDMALAILPRYQGNVSDALLALDVIDPVTLFEHITEHIRHRWLDLFTWKSGAWWFYRGVGLSAWFSRVARQNVRCGRQDWFLQQWRGNGCKALPRGCATPRQR